MQSSLFFFHIKELGMHCLKLGDDITKELRREVGPNTPCSIYFRQLPFSVLPKALRQRIKKRFHAYRRMTEHTDEISCQIFFHSTIIPPWRVFWVSREADKLKEL
jgi:hypothetical protein